MNRKRLTTRCRFEAFDGAQDFQQAQGPEQAEGERTPKAFASRLADRRMTSMKEAVTDAKQRPGFPLRIMKQTTRALVSRRSSCFR